MTGVADEKALLVSKQTSGFTTGDASHRVAAASQTAGGIT